MVDKTESIYTDLDLMPIYNFDKCMNDDLKFMYLSKKGEVNEYVTNEWSKLFDAYCDLTVNSEILRYYRLISCLLYTSDAADE